MFLSLRVQDCFCDCAAAFCFIRASLSFVVMNNSCNYLASLPVSLITSCVVFVIVVKCAAGKKFVPRTDKDDAKCEACPTGTFNANNDNSMECVKRKACTDSKVKKYGNSKKDAECDPGMRIYIYMVRAGRTCYVRFMRYIGFELACLPFLLFVPVYHLSF